MSSFLVRKELMQEEKPVSGSHFHYTNFDANYALFCRSAAKAVLYQPDKRSYINPEHLKKL